VRGGGVNVKAIAAAFEKKALNASLKNGFSMMDDSESKGGQCGKCGEICYPLSTVMKCTCVDKKPICPNLNKV